MSTCGCTTEKEKRLWGWRPGIVYSALSDIAEGERVAGNMFCTFFSISQQLKAVILSLPQPHIKAKWGTEDYKKEAIHLCFL